MIDRYYIEGWPAGMNSTMFWISRIKVLKTLTKVQVTQNSNILQFHAIGVFIAMYHWTKCPVATLRFTYESNLLKSKEFMSKKTLKIVLWLYYKPVN